MSPRLNKRRSSSKHYSKKEKHNYNSYKVLELNEAASIEDVINDYRRFAWKYHPRMILKLKLKTLKLQSFRENYRKPKTNKPINMVSTVSLIHLGKRSVLFSTKTDQD